MPPARHRAPCGCSPSPHSCRAGCRALPSCRPPSCTSRRPPPASRADRVGVELHELAEAAGAGLLVAEDVAGAVAAIGLWQADRNSRRHSAPAARSGRSAARSTARRRPGTRTRPRWAGPGRAGICRARRCIRTPASPPARNRRAHRRRGFSPPSGASLRSRRGHDLPARAAGARAVFAVFWVCRPWGALVSADGAMRQPWLASQPRPALAGEVGIRRREFRVRGLCRGPRIREKLLTPSDTNFRGERPLTRPSPREKRGEGARERGLLTPRRPSLPCLPLPSLGCTSAA